MKTLLTTLALLATLGSAQADPAMTANQWVSQCDSKEVPMRIACKQYALGVAEGLTLWLILHTDSAVICIPEKANDVQFVAVARKYYKDNPKDRHRTALVLLSLAYKEAWPCDDDEPKKKEKM